MHLDRWSERIHGNYQIRIENAISCVKSSIMRPESSRELDRKRRNIGWSIFKSDFDGEKSIFGYENRIQLHNWQCKSSYKLGIAPNILILVTQRLPVTSGL